MRPNVLSALAAALWLPAATADDGKNGLVRFGWKAVGGAARYDGLVETEAGRAARFRTSGTEILLPKGDGAAGVCAFDRVGSLLDCVEAILAADAGTGAEIPAASSTCLADGKPEYGAPVTTSPDGQAIKEASRPRFLFLTTMTREKFRVEGGGLSYAGSSLSPGASFVGGWDLEGDVRLDGELAARHVSGAALVEGGATHKLEAVRYRAESTLSRPVDFLGETSLRLGAGLGLSNIMRIEGDAGPLESRFGTASVLHPIAAASVESRLSKWSLADYSARVRAAGANGNGLLGLSGRALWWTSTEIGMIGAGVEAWTFHHKNFDAGRRLRDGGVSLMIGLGL